jgi:hypothetical protein
MNTCHRITATDGGESLTLSIAVGAVTASAVSRTLSGPLVTYGVPGRTSKGKLKVAVGALEWPADITAAKLTKEHLRHESRGHIVAVEDPATDGGTIRVTARVSDGPDGDAALREAQDKTRDGFSFDIVDAVIRGDTIVSGRVVAVGQVGIPAYDSMRIDSIAASTPTEGTTSMNPEQIARLKALRAKQNLTADEQAELAALMDAAAAAATADAPADDTPPAAPAAPATQVAAGLGVTASIPALPAGVPAPTRQATTTRDRADDLTAFVSSLFAMVNPTSGTSEITAALNDITSTQHTSNTEAPGWSGELWSGVQYEPEFSNLLNTGSLTNFEGRGWRWVVKPAIADYAGDKAAIPSNTPTTEDSEYTAARMAVGHDIDRKFYDFPNEAFIRSYVECVREDWSMKLDAKVHAWMVANAVAVESAPGVPLEAPTLLGAVGKAIRAVKRRKAGRASFVVVSDNDFDTLMDIAEQDAPKFLELFNIDPSKFVSSELLDDGTVLAGAKQTATLRTLPGSPIRVSAQHIANGGIDEAFFGYWAIEEHHTSGIASVQFVPAP